MPALLPTRLSARLTLLLLVGGLLSARMLRDYRLRPGDRGLA